MVWKGAKHTILSATVASLITITSGYDNLHASVSHKGSVDLIPPEERIIKDENKADTQVMTMLQQRARNPNGSDKDRALQNMARDYSDMGSEEELLELLSKVDARTELSLFHKNRRRKNNMAPCEDTSPSDADNEDCHIRRYRMMQSMLGPQVTVSSEATQLSTELDVLRKSWEGVSYKIDSALDITYGPGGSKENPAEGSLVSDVHVLGGALLELYHANVAASSELWDEFSKIDRGYAEDINDLKKDVKGSLTNLVKGIQTLQNEESNTQHQNLAILGQQGNNMLEKAVYSVNEQQGKIEKGVAKVEKAFEDLGGATSQNVDEAARGMQDLEDDLQSGSAKIDSTLSNTEHKVRENLKDYNHKLSAFEANELGKFSNDMSTMAHTFNEQSSQLIQKVGRTWDSMSAKRSDEARGIIKTEKQRFAAASKDITEAAQKVENSSTKARTDFVDKSSKEWSDQANSYSDLSSEIKGVVGVLQRFSEDSQAEVDQLSDATSQSEQTLRREVSSLLFSSGSALGEALMSLAGQMSDAEGDLRKDSEASKKKVVDILLSMWKENGANSVKMSSILAKLLDTVNNGENLLANRLRHDLRAASEETATMGSELQEEVETSMHALTSAAEKSKKSTEESKEQLAHSVETTNQSINDTIDDSSIKIRKSLDNAAGLLEEDGVALDSQIGKAAVAGERITRSIGELKAGISGAESQLLQGERRDEETKQHVAAHLADSDEAIADKLQEFVSANRQAVEDKLATTDAAASRQFAELGNLAASGLQNYENEGQRSEAEVKARLNMDNSRNENVQKQLGDVAGEITKIMNTEDKETRDITDNFKKHMSTELSDTEAGSEEALAKFSADEGTAQEELDKYANSKFRHMENLAEDNLKRQREKISQESAAFANEQSRSSVAANKMAAESEDFSKKIEKYDHDVDDIKGKISASNIDFETKFKSLAEEFATLSTKETGNLKELVSGFQEKLDKLPQLLSKSADDVQAQYLVSENELRAKIRELNATALNGTSEEEKKRAKDSLDLLTKMQALIGKIKSSDKMLREKIMNGESVSEEKLNKVEDGVSDAIGVFKGLDLQMENDDKSFREKIKRANTKMQSVYSTMESSLKEAGTVMEREEKEAELGASFDVQSAKMGENKKIENLEKEANNAKDLANKQNTQLTNLELQERHNINSLHNTVVDFRSQVESRVARVFTEISRSEGAVFIAQGNEKADITTRLGLVRQSIKNFLDLWAEYSVIMDHKFNRFHAADRLLLTTLENKARDEVSKSLIRVENAVAHYRKLDAKINEADKEEQHFEDVMETKVKDLRQSTEKLQEGRDALLGRVRTSLANIAKWEQKVDDIDAAEAKYNINKFVEDILKRSKSVLENAELNQDAQELNPKINKAEAAVASAENERNQLGDIPQPPQFPVVQ